MGVKWVENIKTLYVCILCKKSFKRNLVRKNHSGQIAFKNIWSDFSEIFYNGFFLALL